MWVGGESMVLSIGLNATVGFLKAIFQEVTEAIRLIAFDLAISVSATSTNTGIEQRKTTPTFRRL